MLPTLILEWLGQVFITTCVPVGKICPYYLFWGPLSLKRDSKSESKIIRLSVEQDYVK